jgi:8-amino-3,8-dideoxy-alpha-D-manno-octulosonate transaminase
MPGTELFGAEERKEVMDVLDTGVLFRYNHDNERKGIWKTRTFEQEFAEFHGIKHAHMVTSGTTAVSVAMASAGVGAGHEVIVPPFTFMATVEAVLMAGAIPVFAEIDETLCLSVEGIKAVLTENTKAIVVVHMCGAMADIEGIKALCDERNIVLIEDTAQALGAKCNGKMLGTFGKTASYSFDFFKIITAGEGGCVITNDDEVYENMHTFSDHGHNHQGDNRGAEDHPNLGYNFRMGELNAAVALAQFRKLPTILELQRKHKKVLKDHLAQYENVNFRSLPDPEGDSATMLNIFMSSEEEARQTAAKMAEVGIPCAYWYDNNYHYIRNWDHIKGLKTVAPLAIQLLDNLPQDYQSITFPKSDNVVGRLISIMIKLNWEESDLNDLCAKFDQVLR